MKVPARSLASVGILTSSLAAEPPAFKWKEVEIDKIEIGYGLY